MAWGEAFSQPLAVVTILKGMIGAGILNLPYVFGRVHLALAVPGYLVISAVAAFSVWRLLECKAALCGSPRTDAPLTAAADDKWEEDSASTLAEEVEDRQDDFGLGPLASVAFQTLGLPGVAMAGFGIVVSQLGFCVAYLNVVFRTLSGPDLLGPGASALPARAGVCAVLCLLSLVRRLDSLGRLSGLALLIYAYLLGALLRWGSKELQAGGAKGVWLPVRWESAGQWFGTAMFAQEAIVICQTVYDDMQLSSPRAFIPVLVASFGICGVLSAFIGGFGYLCYGDETKDMFYLNFPAESSDVKAAEIILCLVLLMTFVLQMFPVVRFGEAIVRWVLTGRSCEATGSSSSSSEETRGSCLEDLLAVAVRWGLVLLASLTAALVPQITTITAYSGNFAISTIGFFLPPLCHMKVHKFQLTPLEWVGDAVLLVAGALAMVLGLVSS